MSPDMITVMLGTDITMTDPPQREVTIFRGDYRKKHRADERTVILDKFDMFLYSLFVLE